MKKFWEVEDQNPYIIVREEGEVITYTDGGHERPDIIAEVIDKQNAHLVAAAPELLAAARLAVQLLDLLLPFDASNGRRATQALRSAIEKAEEESEV